MVPSVPKKQKREPQFQFKLCASTSVDAAGFDSNEQDMLDREAMCVQEDCFDNNDDKEEEEEDSCEEEEATECEPTPQQVADSESRELDELSEEQHHLDTLDDDKIALEGASEQILKTFQRLESNFGNRHEWKSKVNEQNAMTIAKCIDHMQMK